MSSKRRRPFDLVLKAGWFLVSSTWVGLRGQYSDIKARRSHPPGSLVAHGSNMDDLKEPFRYLGRRKPQIPPEFYLLIPRLHQNLSWESL